jgi:hypothetical protein
MIFPNHLSGMEEGNDFSAQSVETLRLGVLMVVASLTGEGQVFRVIGSTFSPWCDVLDAVRLCRELFRTPAVFATTTRPTVNQILDFLCYGHTFCHSGYQVTDAQLPHHLRQGQAAQLRQLSDGLQAFGMEYLQPITQSKQLVGFRLVEWADLTPGPQFLISLDTLWIRLLVDLPK